MNGFNSTVDQNGYSGLSGSSSRSADQDGASRSAGQDGASRSAGQEGSSRSAGQEGKEQLELKAMLWPGEPDVFAELGMAPSIQPASVPLPNQRGVTTALTYQATSSEPVSGRGRRVGSNHIPPLFTGRRGMGRRMGRLGKPLGFITKYHNEQQTHCLIYSLCVLCLHMCVYICDFEVFICIQN